MGKTGGEGREDRGGIFPSSKSIQEGSRKKGGWFSIELEGPLGVRGDSTRVTHERLLTAQITRKERRCERLGEGVACRLFIRHRREGGREGMSHGC